MRPFCFKHQTLSDFYSVLYIKRHFNSLQSQGNLEKSASSKNCQLFRGSKVVYKKIWKVTMWSQLGERSKILTFTDVTPCVHSNPIKLSPIQFSDTNLPFIKLLSEVYICTAPVADYNPPPNPRQLLELTQLSSHPCTMQRHRICSPWIIFWKVSVCNYFHVWHPFRL